MILIIYYVVSILLSTIAYHHWGSVGLFNNIIKLTFLFWTLLNVGIVSNILRVMYW